MSNVSLVQIATDTLSYNMCTWAIALQCAHLFIYGRKAAPRQTSGSLIPYHARLRCTVCYLLFSLSHDQDHQVSQSSYDYHNSVHQSHKMPLAYAKSVQQMHKPTECSVCPRRRILHFGAYVTSRFPVNIFTYMVMPASMSCRMLVHMERCAC